MTDEPGEAARYPIRTATAETMESFAAPLSLAFAEKPEPGDEERRTWEPDRIIAAFDGDRPADPIKAAQAAASSMAERGGQA